MTNAITDTDTAILPTADSTTVATAAPKQVPVVRVYGIRHHGPGSSRSLVKELDLFQPDCVLVEGPPEGATCLELVLEPDMNPPVALLSYVPGQPHYAVYSPFAEYSPEWQAIRFALSRRLTVRFIDMPLAHVFGLEIAEDQTKANAPESTTTADPVLPPTDTAPSQSAEETPEAPSPHHDPLGWLAEAAGFSDGERWWEFMVEQRKNHEGIFEAILDAMTSLRAEMPPLHDPGEQLRENRREAFMRAGIRDAIKEGFLKIAVVCGAWHAPVLVPERMPKVKDDQALMKGLPKAKVQSTWIPWTNDRLCWRSGYRAGIDSPGWYGYLWHHRNQIAERWLTLVARLLREHGLDASCAQVIDAVRMAEALAALRGRPLPALPEMEEASRAIFCFGADAQLDLIRNKLMVGETLGRPPEKTPLAPLMADLEREQKRLRFPPKASSDIVTLDLRKDNDLDRSRLLHRLALLGVSWGELRESGGGKGTFKEIWQTAWKPEFAILLIERGVWGNTVLEAAEGYVRHLTGHADSLEALTRLIGGIFLADLPRASAYAVQQLQNEAALAPDITHLMHALPPLARVMRYGNVRQTDASLVWQVVEGMAARICVGLPMACGSLNDDAAAGMLVQINEIDESLRLLQDTPTLVLWRESLSKIVNLPRLNGLIGGRATRLLLDGGTFSAEEGTKRFSLGLSDPDPTVAAGWLQGFLDKSGLILIHDDRLWALVMDWVGSLPAKTFDMILPLIRRTFSEFPSGERRQMGEKVKQGSRTLSRASIVDQGLHLDRANSAMPILARLLGLTLPQASEKP